MKNIWIDTDLSVGMQRTSREGYCDVDDGYAVLQLMKSEEVYIHGISAVFGNTDIDNAYRLSQFMSENFERYEIPVYKGAGEEMNLLDVKTNEAVEAMAASLRSQKLTILAIGPATNVGILLVLYPQLIDQIEEVILVAGRRKHTDYFDIGNQGRRAMDANFDKDVNSFRIMMQYGVSVTLCPFEISHKVWLDSEDLVQLDNDETLNAWLAEKSYNWLNQWKAHGAKGFNPFDVLASHYIISPEDIISETLQAKIEIFPDDTKEDNDDKAYKPYLLCGEQGLYKVKYCYDVTNDYHDKLMNSLT